MASSLPLARGAPHASALRSAHVPRPRALQLARRRVAASAVQNSDAEDSRGLLEAFFVGRALAEVLNERLGAALGDALAEVGKLDAETRRSIRKFQEEVLERARSQMDQSAGAAPAALRGGSGAPYAPPPPVDLVEAVDELRADVAATRAVVQQLKLQHAAGAGRGR